MLLDRLLNHLDVPAAERGRRISRAAGIVVGSLVAVVIAASQIQTDVVVEAPGRLRAATEAPPLISAEGGRVEHLAVRMGQHVKRGDVLATFAPTKAASDLQQRTTSADALRARIARLEAVVSGGKPNWPTGVEKGYIDAERATFDAEGRAFVADKAAKEAAVVALGGKLAQLQQQEKLASTQLGQLQAGQNVREYDIVERRKEIAKLAEEEAETQGALAKARADAAQSEAVRLTKASDDLSDAKAKLAVAAASADGASVAVDDTVLKAPYDGRVNGPKVAEGSTVTPGAPVLDLTPDGSLVAELAVKPEDMDGIVEGLATHIKVRAKDYLEFGMLDGVVQTVGADSVVNERTGEAHYRVVVQPTGELRGRDGKAVVLSAGATVTGDLVVGRRSLGSYLTQPVRWSSDRAFAEK